MRADGSALRLFELFRTNPSADGYRSPEAFACYDATGGAEILVRPDGYIG